MKTELEKIILKKRYILTISTIIFIFILCGGYLFYTTEESRIRAEKFNILKSVADLKVNQILDWRSERIADANVISKSPLFIQSFEDFLLYKKISEKHFLLERLALVHEHYFYKNVIIATVNGKLLLSLDSAYTKTDSTAVSMIMEAAKTKKTIFGNLFKTSCNDCIRIFIAAPILNKEKNSIGVLLFMVDPYHYLYPLIQSWPIPNKSSETLLISKDGDNVVYLNELRHKKYTALSLKKPLSNLILPSTQAVLGKTGIFDGKDYRGIKVLAYLSPLPGTDWYMVAKIDRSEILAELHFRETIVMLFMIILILLLSICLAWLFQYRQRNIFKELYHIEKKLLETQEEFKTTLYSIGDAVITTDTFGKVQTVNPVAEELTGWREIDAKGKPLEEIFNIINEESLEKVESPVHRVLREGVIVGLANHTLLISKDGKETAIADSGAPIKNERNEIIGVVLVFRDQTQERAARMVLAENEERYRQLFDNMSNGVAIYTPINNNNDFVIKDINRAGEKLSHVNKKDIIGRRLSEVFPGAEEYGLFDAFRRTLKSGNPEIVPLKIYKDDRIQQWVENTVYPLPSGEVVAIYDDTTEKAKAQEALRESEAKYKSLFTSTNDGICLHELVFDSKRNPLDYTILDVNKKFEEIIGISSDDSIGKKATELYLTDSPPYLDIYSNVAMTGEPTAFETYFPPMKKHFRISVYSPEKGKFATVFQDITERINTENALIKEHDFVQNITETSPVGITVVNKFGQIIYANPRAEDIFGLKKDDITQLAYNAPEWQITDFKGNDYSVEKLPFTLVKTHLKPVYDVKHAIRWKEGKINFLSINATPIFDENGNFDGIVATIEDITNRKQAEEDILSLNTRLQALLEAVPDIIMEVDNNKNYTWANQAGIEFFGEDVLGKEAEYYFEGEQDTYQNVQPLFNGNEDIIYVESLQRRKDGEKRLLAWWCRNLKDKGGNSIGALSTARDITEIRLAEEEIRRMNEKLEIIVQERTAELEAANKEMESFIYSVSHDLRAPLRSISGFSEIISMRHKCSLNEEGQQYFDYILEASANMADLIEALLQFSRLAKKTLEKDLVSINEIINLVLQNLDKDITETKADIKVSTIFPLIQGDKNLLYQIFLNLISNALLYHKKGCPPEIEISFVEDEISVEIAIKDKGIGIANEFFEKIFNVFQRLHSQEDYPGTGIGLAIVKKAVDAHNGKVWVESKLGKGSTFFVKFPK